MGSELQVPTLFGADLVYVYDVVIWQFSQRLWAIYMMLILSSGRAGQGVDIVVK